MNIIGKSKFYYYIELKRKIDKLQVILELFQNFLLFMGAYNSYKFWNILQNKPNLSKQQGMLLKTFCLFPWCISV